MAIRELERHVDSSRFTLGKHRTPTSAAARRTTEPSANRTAYHSPDPVIDIGDRIARGDDRLPHQEAS